MRAWRAKWEKAVADHVAQAVIQVALDQVTHLTWSRKWDRHQIGRHRPRDR